jgi:cell division protein FtsB
MPKRLIVAAGIAGIVLGFAIIGMGIAQWMGQHERELRQQAQQEQNKQLQLQLDQLKSQIDQLKAQPRNAPAPK